MYPATGAARFSAVSRPAGAHATPPLPMGGTEAGSGVPSRSKTSATRRRNAFSSSATADRASAGAASRGSDAGRLGFSAGGADGVLVALRASPLPFPLAELGRSVLTGTGGGGVPDAALECTRPDKRWRRGGRSRRGRPATSR